MPVNNRKNSDEPKWPSDYTLYPDQDIIQMLEKESQNTHAPAPYKDFFSRLVQYTHNKTKEIAQREEAIRQLEEKCGKGSLYVQMAREHYDVLATLYKDEHNYYLDMQENRSSLRAEHESYRSQLEQMTDELKQSLSVAEKEKTRVEKEYQEYRERTAGSAEKGGIERRDLERTLMLKEVQIEMLEKKTDELQRSIATKTKEVEEANTKYKAVTTMLQMTRYMQKQHN